MPENLMGMVKQSNNFQQHIDELRRVLNLVSKFKALILVFDNQVYVGVGKWWIVAFFIWINQALQF